MKEPKNIEELIKESFNGFEADPGANAWSNIHAQLNSPIASTTSTPNNGIWAASGSKAVTAIIAVSIIGLSLAGFFYFDSAGNNNKIERVNNQEQPTPIVVTPAKNKIELTNSTESSIVIEKKKESKEDIKVVKKVEKPVLNTTEDEQLSTSIDNNSVSNEIRERPKKESINTEKESTPISTEAIKPNTTETISESNNASNDKQINAIKNNNTPEPEIIENTVIEETEAPVFKFPNIFTPNGDNMNDVFKIEVEEAENIQVQIFNKGLKLIHQWEGQYGFWDGLNNDGTRAPKEVYFYKAVIVKDGKTYVHKDQVTLER